MSNTEKNRQIVQEGLNRKKTARRQRMTDAAHDAAERQLRVTINQITQEHRDAIEAAEAEQRRREEARMQRAAERAQEDAEVKQTLRFIAKVFDGMLYAALMAFAFTHEAVSANVAFAAVGLAIIYCIAAFYKHTAKVIRERRAA